MLMHVPSTTNHSANHELLCRLNKLLLKYAFFDLLISCLQLGHCFEDKVSYILTF